MPEQPSWIDKVNFVRFWLSNDCNVPWVVYFETAIPALGRMIFTLVSFGILDLIRGFFRPAGLRRGRHGRKSDQRRGRRGGIPDTAEMFAKRIPGQVVTSARQVTDGVRNLWVVDSFIQRIAYKLLIFTVVGDFFYDWTSAIIQDDRTKCEGFGRGMRRDAAHVFTIGDWGQLLVNDLIYLDGNVPFGPGSVHFPEGRWFLTIACKARIFGPGTNAQAQIGLSPFSDLSGFLDTSSRVDLIAGSTADLVTSFPLQGPGSITYRGLALDNPVEFYEITAFFMQHSEGPSG